MDWTEVSIVVNAKDVEMAGNIANMVVPYGIYIEDYSNLEEETMEIAHIDMIDEELLKKDRNRAIIHVYISPEENPAEAVSYLRERYSAAGIENQINMSDCAVEDWINNWKKFYKPMMVGERLLIRPAWEKDFPVKGRKVLKIEPGLAFGTGTHETTRLCIELIEDYLRPQMNILDVGCGSGILSIAALLLGGNKATAVDIDELAVKTAMENAALNNLQDRYTAVQGDLTSTIEGSYHMVLANIVADAVIELSENIMDYMFCDTVYIVSGIIESREQDVRNALEKKFEIIDRREENNWIAFAAQPKRLDTASMLGVDFGSGAYSFMF